MSLDKILIRKQGKQLADIVTLAPNGTDDTINIQNILDSGKILRLIQGVYIATTLSLDDGTKIITSGLKTKLKQKDGTPSETRLLKIIGSNVFVDDMSYEGNISTTTGEQNHAVFIMNTAKQIQNIKVGNIVAINMRGDALYIGGDANYNPRNIKIGNVYATNCYRNGISLTGCQNVEIGEVIALQCGVMGVDLESDTQGGHNSNIKIGNIITSNIGILASGAGYSYCENIEIGFVTLRRSSMGSVPDYPIVDTDSTGITFRNSRNIKIKGLDIDGFDKFAISFMFSGDDRYNDKITIDNLRVVNCSLDDTTYNAYISLGGADTIEINNIDSIVQAPKSLFLGTSKTSQYQNVIVKNAIHNGDKFANTCGVNLTNVVAISTGKVLQSIKQLSKAQNCTFSGTDIITYSDNVIFEGNKLTYTVTKENNGINVYRNNIINTIYQQ